MPIRFPTLRQVVFATVSAMAVLVVSPDLSRSAPSDPSIPSAASVLATMERVGDWQLAHPSKHPADDWTQGTGYVGLTALGNLSSSPRFLAAMEKMGESNGWKLGPRRYHADDHCVGQTYLDLFIRRKDLRMIRPLEEEFDAILAEPKNDDLNFDHPGALDKWVWCDALFMDPPVWTRLFFVTGKQAYLDSMIERWWKTSDYLYDPEEHLFLRDSRLFSQREENGKKIFWGRGNGWVLAGLARVLEYLPLAHPSRPRFEKQFEDMAAKIVSLQQPDGLWRSSLLDPANYPMREASGTAFFCYALTWGINHQLLPRETYEPAVGRAWAALNQCVEPDGKLNHVQPIGFTPKTFDPESTEVFGTGAFLLAGSEIYRLAQSRAVTPL
jgi:unsaturated rhamnogalacturonyl hydrolase